MMLRTLIPETFFSIREETLLFLLSCAAGAVIGVLWDILRTVRLMIHHSSFFIMTEDLLFLCGYGVFLASFASAAARGELRGYFIIGSLLGYIVYYFTVGKIMMSTVRKLLGVLKIFASVILAPLRACYALIRKKADIKFVGSNKVLVRFIKKVNMLLPNHREMMYNKIESRKRKM